MSYFDNVPLTKVQVEMPLAKPMKLTKKQYSNKKATSDQFWRRKFMQVLEAIHDDSLHFNLESWSKYGVSDHEQKVILKEFDRQQEWRLSVSKEKVDFFERANCEKRNLVAVEETFDNK